MLTNKLQTPPKNPPKIYLIAGEPSGDFIGGKLITHLKKINPSITIKGIGGTEMAAAGLSSLFNIKHISIMGIFEILPKLVNIIKLLKKTIQDIKSFQPDILITIDSPGFNLTVAKKIKKLYGNKIKLVHYVAPSVWAYKEKRAKKFAKIFNYLLCILPFEPPYFLKEGLKAYFVGHPIIESGADKANKEAFLQKYNLPPAYKNMVVLPGSRLKEVKSKLGIFLNSITLLQKSFPHLNIIIPTVPYLKNYITELVNDYYQTLTKAPAIIITDNTEEKYQAFKAADLAIAASGTVSLELALAKTPTIIAYKLNYFTTLIAKLILKIKYVSLINIIANKKIIPEYLGENCTAAKIASAATKILKGKFINHSEEIEKILQTLGYNNFVPSYKAAEIINKIIKQEI